MPRGIQTELPRRPLEPRDQRAARHLAEYGRESYVCGAQTTAPEALQGAAAVAARPAVHAIGKNLPYRVGIFSGVPVCYYAST